MLRSRKRTEALQSHYGKEYDRTVEAQGDQSAAERDLLDRQAERSSFEVRALDPARREEFARSWERTQGHFVDDPAGAVAAAYGLVRTSDASGRGEASTEDLREAMVHYRSLFDRLLDTHDAEGTRAP